MLANPPMKLTLAAESANPSTKPGQRLDMVWGQGPSIRRLN